MFEIIIKPKDDLLDYREWDEFSRALTGIVDNNGNDIIIDLESVNHMSSSYIGSIIAACQTAERQGKNFRLINVGGRLYDLLDMLNLTDILSIDRI